MNSTPAAKKERLFFAADLRLKGLEKVIVDSGVKAILRTHLISEGGAFTIGVLQPDLGIFRHAPEGVDRRLIDLAVGEQIGNTDGPLRGIGDGIRAEPGLA